MIIGEPRPNRAQKTRAVSGIGSAIDRMADICMRSWLWMIRLRLLRTQASISASLVIVPQLQMPILPFDPLEKTCRGGHV